MKLIQRVQSTAATLKQVNWLKALFFTATIALGVLYIWQVNVAATRGFTMRELEQDIHALALENERLNMDVARLQSMESVTTRVKMLGLTHVDRIEYVTPGEGAVAINR